VRTWNIAKHLTSLGWDVTVVTPDPSVWRHADDAAETTMRIQQAGIRRILTGHRWRCLDPVRLRCWNTGLGWVAGGLCRTLARRLQIDAGAGWIKEAERACSNLIPSDVDVILATGPPFVTFVLARRLAERLGRPYVLDYRDPWTNSPHAARPARPATIREEARLLTGATAVTIVSRSWASLLDRCFGLGSKLHVVTNGFDAEELASVKPHAFGHFAIVYAGVFYPPKRVISPVMAALQRLDAAMPDLRGKWYFHYYGIHQDHVSEEAKRFGVTERVVLHGRVPRAEALSAVRGAGTAVVITSVMDEATDEDAGIVTGKVFETIGLRTPILLIAPVGSDARTVVGSGVAAKGFTGSDTDGMAAYLSELILSGTTGSSGASEYAWSMIARRLDAVLRGAARPDVRLSES
jgi:glycosyltransferase involved in cell wall biosynthesis